MFVDLTVAERQLLSAGLDQWGGPARPTNQLAAALGFVDVADLLDEADRISDLLDEGHPLSSLDTTRALAATEISFVSDVFGAGVEWQTVTGLTDEETIAVLRGLQRKLVSEYGSFFSES